MRYLFDTNACIALLNGRSPSLLDHLRHCKPGDVGLPSLVLYELYYGAFKSQRRSQNLNLLDRIGFEIVPFEASDARMSGAIRSQLESIGHPIGPYDTLIAGQALARGLVLVTSNSREFRRVDGLDWEDWSITGASD